MITFVGWRDAGQAMRWARTQPGVTASRKTFGASTDNRWHSGGDTVVVITHIRGGNAVSIGVDTPGAEAERAGGNTAQILDLLTALGLLPVRMSSAYRTGYAHGRMDLAKQVLDAAGTYAVIERTGKDTWRGGEPR